MAWTNELFSKVRRKQRFASACSMRKLRLRIALTYSRGLQIDQDGNGKLDLNEYIDAVKKHPQLLGLILGPTPKTDTKAQAAKEDEGAPKQKEGETKLPPIRDSSRRSVLSGRFSMLHLDKAEVPNLLPMPHK